jgi:hypothetical protein
MTDVEAPHLDMLLNAVRTLEPLIREHTDEAEQNRRLSQPVVTALAEAGIFRMYTPHTLGGFEVDPLTFYRVVEDIARIDASTAWCVLIASGNPAFAGACLPDQGAEAVFGKDLHVATGGVVFPFGKAVVRDGGYVVSGRWPFASGCQHCAWIFCCCIIFDGDQMRLTERGDPEVRVLFVPTTQITIVDTWEVSGLVGTGSHDVEIEQVFVPEEYTGIFASGMPPPGQALPGSAVPLSVLSCQCPADWCHCPGDRPRGSGDVSRTGADKTACRDHHAAAGAPGVSRPAGGSRGLGALGPGVVIRRGAADLGDHADYRRGLLCRAR